MNKKGIVFIVDDDSSSRKGLTRLLLAAGYEVNAYTSSEELLKSLITDRNACLVLDARTLKIRG